MPHNPILCPVQNHAHQGDAVLQPLRDLDQIRNFISGGGPGVMEAANRGAMEAGAPSVAMNISLPHEQAPNPYVTPGLSFQFHYFALRKMHFAMRAKALISFPGGFGTLDELFEILTLVQTRKVQATPVLLYGSDFWKRLIDFDWLVSSGTIAKEDLACLHYLLLFHTFI